jgi:hypothetical protein
MMLVVIGFSVLAKASGWQGRAAPAEVYTSFGNPAIGMDWRRG